MVISATMYLHVPSIDPKAQASKDHLLNNASRSLFSVFLSPDFYGICTSYVHYMCFSHVCVSALLIVLQLTPID